MCSGGVPSEKWACEDEDVLSIAFSISSWLLLLPKTLLCVIFKFIGLQLLNESFVTPLSC